MLEEMKIVFDPYEALEGAHAAVLVTEWEEIKTLDLRTRRHAHGGAQVLVDGRNAFEPDSAWEAGLSYTGFGRKTKASGALPGAPELLAPVA